MKITVSDFAIETTLKHDSTAFRLGREINRKVDLYGGAILDFAHIEHITHRFATLMFLGSCELKNIEERIIIDNCPLDFKNILYGGIYHAKLKKGI